MSKIILDRLLLRPICVQDAQDIFAYSNRVAVGPNAGWKPHETIEETRDIIEQLFIGHETVWGIVLKTTGKMVGSLGLIDDPKRQNPAARMLGYAISDLHWGNGYMTEAVCGVLRYGFEQCGFKLISAYCYPDNDRSRRVLEKNGFVYEGTLKLAEQLYNGVIKDNLCYAITNEKYFKA